MSRFACRISACAVMMLAVVVAGAAQSAGQPSPPQAAKRLADPLGRFTIEYPADWTVNSHVVDETKSGTVFSGFSQSAAAYMDVSLGAQSQPLTAEGFGRSVEEQRRQQDPSIRQLRDGATDLAGSRGYYVYYTVTTQSISYYCFRVYLVIPVPHAAGGSAIYRVFWFDGGTRNDQRWVQTNIPLIQRIIWSFRPQ